MRVRETKIYQLDELSEASKKVAIAKQVESLHQDCFLADMIREDLTYEAEENYGLKLSDLTLEFSLGSCQGDGVAFYGELDHEAMMKLIKRQNEKSFNENNELTFDFHEMELLERFPEISLDITRNCFGNHYSHWNTMLIELDMENMQPEVYELLEKLESFTDSISESFTNLIQSISKELEASGYDMIEGYTSEENAEETINCNDYEFFENGELA